MKITKKELNNLIKQYLNESQQNSSPFREAALNNFSLTLGMIKDVADAGEYMLDHKDTFLAGKKMFIDQINQLPDTSGLPGNLPSKSEIIDKINSFKIEDYLNILEKKIRTLDSYRLMSPDKILMAIENAIAVPGAIANNDESLKSKEDVSRISGIIEAVSYDFSLDKIKEYLYLGLQIVKDFMDIMSSLLLENKNGIDTVQEQAQVTIFKIKKLSRKIMDSVFTDIDDKILNWIETLENLAMVQTQYDGTREELENFLILLAAFKTLCIPLFFMIEKVISVISFLT